MGKSSAGQQAQAQSTFNRSDAVAQQGLNSVDQFTPFGSLTNQQSGTWADGTPRFSQTVSLAPAQQQLLNTSNQTQQNLANMAQNMSSSPLPQGGVWQNNDYSADRQRVEEAMFSRLDPQIDRQRAAMETSLVNRGIRPGSAAYQQEMSTLNNAVNDQRTSVLLNAGQEQSRLQGMDLNSFGAQNTQRSNAFNELQALMGGSQLQQPSFGGTPQSNIANTNVAGMMQAENQNNAGMFNSVLGAAGSLFGLSDRRAKENIKPIGAAGNGLTICAYNYIGNPKTEIGFMAQEVEAMHPDAVMTGPDGYMRVNYAEAVK